MLIEHTLYTLHYLSYTPDPNWSSTNLCLLLPHSCNDNEKVAQTPSSDEDNSPTELNNCKRLTDKPPLVSELCIPNNPPQSSQENQSIFPNTFSWFSLLKQIKVSVGKDRASGQGNGSYICSSHSLHIQCVCVLTLIRVSPLGMPRPKTAAIYCLLSSTIFRKYFTIYETSLPSSFSFFLSLPSLSSFSIFPSQLILRPFALFILLHLTLLMNYWPQQMAASLWLFLPPWGGHQKLFA